MPGVHTVTANVLLFPMWCDINADRDSSGTGDHARPGRDRYATPDGLITSVATFAALRPDTRQNGYHAVAVEAL